MKNALVCLSTLIALAWVAGVSPALAQEEAGGDAVASATDSEVVEAVPVEGEASATAEEAVEVEGEAAPAVESVPASEIDSETGGDITAEATAEATLEADVAPAPKKAVWRNTLFIYENAVSAYSFNKDAELSYNPYYAMSYRFVPRFYLFKGLFLRLDWTLEQELTNSDFTTEKNEVYWSDVAFDLTWGGAATIPKIGVDFTPSLRFILPASKDSQARTLYLGLSPGFSLLKTFDVIGGITLQYSFRYTKYFNKYTGAVSEDPLVECPGTQASCPYYALGPRNPSHSISNSFLLEVRPISALYISASVAIVNRILYPVSATDVPVLGGSYEIQESSNNTNHSGLVQYVFEIGYDLPYLTIALGTSTYNPMLAPNSQYYAPFFNRYTNIYLDFVLYPEAIISKIAKGKGQTDKSYY